MTYDELRVASSRPGILYGLPKVHHCINQELPFVQFFHPLEPVAIIIYLNFLSPHLEHLKVSEFTVKDSFSFAEEISKHQNSDDLVMASFDVKFLFTNIPLEEIIVIIANSLC